MKCSFDGLPGSLASQWTTDKLGQAIDAPTLDPSIVEVPSAFIAEHPELAGLSPGPALAVEYLAAADEPFGHLSTHEAVASSAHLPWVRDRARIASVAVLFGWLGATMHASQFLVIADRCFVTDHAPNLCDWTLDAFAAYGRAYSDLEPHRSFRPMRFTRNELEPSVSKLELVEFGQICEAIEAMPIAWCPDPKVRSAAGEAIERRRQIFIHRYRSSGGANYVHNEVHEGASPCGAAESYAATVWATW